MSYQEPIYNQNGNGERNQTVPVVNLSSDICIFNIPFFTMSGASKINCSEVICDISGVSYNNIFTGGTNCFTSNSFSSNCFSSGLWQTLLYEVSSLVYSGTFYTTTAMTQTLPTVADFSGSVITAFDSRNYIYEFSGTSYTLEQSSNIAEINLDIRFTLEAIDNCVVSAYTPTNSASTVCSCPLTYSATPDNDACFYTTSTAATFNGSGTTIVAGDTNAAYGSFGTYFFPNVTNYASLPLTRFTNTNNLLDQSGGTVLNTVIASNAFWLGRLNAVGLSATSTEWRGFSHCIDIVSGKTFYIGLAADNYCKFSIDGNVILDLPEPNDFDKNFKEWHVIEYDLSSGKHIIEMEGRNKDSNSAFGAEIYDPVNFATLTGATTTGDTGLIFSTFGRAGEIFDIGDTVGYSCPVGYSLDTCVTGTPVCSQLLYTATTCVYTGSCNTVIDTEICDLGFSGLTTGNTNVYVLSSDTTSIDVQFTFTANTSSLTGNTIFRYEVYKYNNSLGIFKQPALYQSPAYKWDSFSATSAFTSSIPVKNLSIDGDYLIKGYYNHDVCTEFAKLTNNKYSTSTFITGDEYGIYQGNRDSYFVAFTPADKPTLGTGEQESDGIGGMLVHSIILTGTESIIALPQTQLNSKYMLALNGLTLSENYDYSLSSNTITTYATLFGATVSGDMFTYIYVSSLDNSTLRNDTIDITSSIVSGATDSEGTNEVYYNTTKSKYEIYTSMTIVNENNMVVTLNGATLANNIDYYLSITNPNRIILEGMLIVGDIITIYYITNIAPQGNTTATQLNLNWGIANLPQTINGLFTMQIADSNDFTNIVSSATTAYVIGQTSYTNTLPLSGSVGTTLYYRVKNDKKYADLCGNEMLTTAYSEIINVTIQTNASNSY